MGWMAWELIWRSLERKVLRGRSWWEIRNRLWKERSTVEQDVLPK